MGIRWAKAGKPVSKPINKHQDADVRNNGARVKGYIWPCWALRQTDEEYIEIVLLCK